MAWAKAANEEHTRPVTPPRIGLKALALKGFRHRVAQSRIASMPLQPRIGGGAGYVFRIDKHAVNVNLHVYYNVEKPTQAGEWSRRFQVQLPL